MSSTPINLHQLQKRIEYDFGIQYNQKVAAHLAVALSQYWKHHQFDEFNDIYDDINNGYDDCCCKQVLFKQLKVTNNQQKKNEYSRLRQCLDSSIVLPKSISDNNVNIFGKIFKCIIKVFTVTFNNHTADNILKLFDHILQQEAFEDIESVKDDVDDIESSTIIYYITEKVNYQQIKKPKEVAKNIIAQGIKCIVENKSKAFVQQYQTKPLSFFDRITNQMQNVFVNKFSKATADIIICQTFDYLIQSNNFHDAYLIIEDMRNIRKSQILHSIISKTSEPQNYLQWISETITKIIQNELVKRKTFDVTRTVNFKVQDEYINETILKVKKYCSIIYKHADDVESNGQDKDLIIAKSIDIMNKYPLLLWFVDMFSRNRIEGHKYNHLIQTLSYDKDSFATNYDVRKWWNNDNKLCQFIYHTTAETVKTAMKIIMRRILPPLNFNHALANTICDSLNAFAKYTLSFHSFAHKIVMSMFNIGKYQMAPIQFDVWIIPQATCASKKPAIFDWEEVYGKVVAANMRNAKRTYNEMGKAASFAKAQNAFWNLEIYLKKCKYKKNKDYLVAQVKNNVNEQLFAMWMKLGLAKQRYRRCIFIVDRRNPINIENKDMGCVKPQIDVPDKNGNINHPTKTWQDTIYFILPKHHNEITAEIDIFPEQSLGLSTKFIFPNPEKREPDAVKILDAMNGYKFALSYHLFSQTNCSTYWYINQGSARFYLQDMKWLWSRFFDQVNNKPQILCQKILDGIDHYTIHKQLPDDHFDEFMVQSQMKARLIPRQKMQHVIVQIGDYFQNQFNVHIGKRIAGLFEYIVNEEEFEDLSNVQEDIDDIEESVIVSYVVDEIETELEPTIKETQKRTIRQKIREIVMTDVPITAQTHIPPTKKPNPPNQQSENIERFTIINNEIEQCIINSLLDLRKATKNLRPRNDMPENTNSEEKEMSIQIITLRTKKQVTKIYGEAIAAKILAKMNTIIAEKKFDIETLVEDVQQIDSSELLNGLDEFKWSFNMNKHEMYVMKSELQQIIKNSKISKPYFNIVLFNFNITKHDVESTTAFINKHCPAFYSNLVGIAKTVTDCELLNGSKLNQKQSNFVSKSLCITKSVDNKNVQPFTYWLLLLYSKERTSKYSLGYLNLKHGYTCNDWWLDNQYCQWMEKTHPIIATYIKVGIGELSKRTLISINYDYTLFPIICDRLNDFAKYAILFHNVAHCIKKLISKGELNISPIHLDYLIIPQMTKTHTNAKSFDVCELKTNYDYNKLTVNKDDEIWDIENILQDNRFGYVKEKNYYVEKVAPFGKTVKQLCNLISRFCQSNIKEQRRNRFIFIIDRRHPENIRNKNLSQKPCVETKKTWPDTLYMIAPKRCRNENREPLCICGAKLKELPSSKTNKCDEGIRCVYCDASITDINQNVWYCDKKNVCEHTTACYVCSECERVRPETFGKLSKQWESIPESCLNSSKKYILFNPNPNKPPISIDNPLNGYKWAFSYHILRQDNIYCYWFHNNGGTVFDPNNIKSLWPQWFEKINGKRQQLDQSIINDLNRTTKLPNAAFEEFEKQCNDITLDL
eukprot:88119_1